jgi:hypothetical protein
LATTEPTTIIGLAALVVSNIGIWIREWRKHKDWKTKNGDVGEIKGDVREIKRDMGSVKVKLGAVDTDLKNFGRTCARHDEEIRENRKAILKIAGGE